MKKLVKYSLLLIVFFSLQSWGFYAHKLINEYAIYTLPTELSLFFKANRMEIIERSVNADKRSHVDSSEAIRHYIDIEDFEEESIDSIPIHWSLAKEKYQERRIKAAGILPWQIYFSYNNLVQAFKSKDAQRIIRVAADLGHYIGDAHVPLHTTSNYNGQFTDQIGIHAFWESRIPEMFGPNYRMLAGKAQWIDTPLENAWQMIKESHAMVKPVLDTEKNLSREHSKKSQKSYIMRKNILVHTYSDEYADAYHEALEGMVEERLTSSVHRVGSYWYSAWIEAGQPDLTRLIKRKIKKSEYNVEDEWTPPENTKQREEW